MRIKLITGCLLVLMWVGAASAQIENEQTITKTGTTSAQFLKIGVDARGSSMGSAFVAAEGDISSMFWNPAGLGHLRGMETVFVHNQWLADINFNYAAFAFNMGSAGVLGFSLTSLMVPDDVVRTVENPEGTGELFSASDLALQMTYSRRLTDKFSIGGSVKYIQQTIWHSRANAVALDIGALFTTPFKGIRLGASLSNFGNDMRMNGRDLRFSQDPDPNNQGNVEFVNALYETDAFPLPLLFRVGIAGELTKTDQMRITYAIDAINPNDNRESINAGLEFVFSELLYVRTGYTSAFQGDREEGLTYGGGLHYRVRGSSAKIKIDFARARFNRLSNVNRFAIGISF